MDVRVVILFLVACNQRDAPSIHALAEIPGCTCVCSEAGIEPDAAPIGGDLTAPWTRTTITASTPTGIFRGADGVALDSDGCWVTAWEEGGAVTRACLVNGSWQTEIVAVNVPGVEDAKAADLDGDGILDVVSCSDSGGRCYATFRGTTTNVTITLTGSMGHGHVMQAAISDVNGDGLSDVLFGTRAGSYANPAVIAWLENPGVLARVGAAWSYHLIDLAGWTMSLIALPNGRIVTSDRSYTFAANGAHLWDRNGVRWLEQVSPDVWTSHPISPPSGACPAGQPMCTTKTPGDVMFATVHGDEVWNCQSSNAADYSRIVRYSTTDWITWTTTVLPAAANVGHCQGIAVIPGGVAVSTWKGNALPLTAAAATQSGVYWLHAPEWSRGEISGLDGAKFDNIESLGNCVITSEQLDPATGGVLLYCPGGAP